MNAQMTAAIVGIGFGSKAHISHIVELDGKTFVADTRCGSAKTSGWTTSRTVPAKKIGATVEIEIPERSWELHYMASRDFLKASASELAAQPNACSKCMKEFC